MNAALERVLFPLFVAFWAITWLPLTIIFVTSMIPIFSASSLAKQGDYVGAAAFASVGMWPVWVTSALLAVLRSIT